MTTPLFLYGTLRDRALLEIVLGRPVAEGDLRPGELLDHAAYEVAGESYPIIVAAPNAAAPGLLISGLSADDMARLDYYECGFDYALLERAVRDGAGQSVTARVYVAPTQGVALGPRWDLQAWVDRWAPMVRLAAQEMMSYMGQRRAEDLVALYPQMLRRAQSQLFAAQTPPPEGRAVLSRADVSVMSAAISYSEFFVLRDYDLSHARFSGAGRLAVRRACFIGFDAAIVLPYDPGRDRVLLVEQFRVGVFARGAPRPWMLEPVAGLVDPGETPEEAARREAEEEAGITLGPLERVAGTYPSPGASSEFHHIFVGLCDLPDGSGETGGGLDHEGEDIRSHLLGFDALMDLLDRGEAENGPLVQAALWLARNRARLRAGGL